MKELNLENNATEVCPDSNSATLKDENDEEKYCGVKISAFEIPSGATTLKISQSETSRNLISESQKLKRFCETKFLVLENKFLGKIVTADYFKSCDRCEPATKFDPDSDSFFKIHFSTSYAWNITAAGPFKVPLRVWVS